MIQHTEKNDTTYNKTQQNDKNLDVTTQAVLLYHKYYSSASGGILTIATLYIFIIIIL